jgi:hypothetical protein
MKVGESDAVTDSWGRSELYGSWRVVSAKGVVVHADGTRAESESSPEGVIIFTPEHRMIAFVTRPGRKPAKNDQDKLKLFQSMVVYSGRFSLEPGKYIVNIDWSSTALNQNEPQIRLYSIDRDTLRIEVPEHKSIFDETKRNSNILVAIREK